MKYYYQRLSFLIALALCVTIAHPQSVLFYNVENFFDCKNDTLTNDDEFTPDGDRHWTPQKQRIKRDNIAKVILASGGWSSPSIVGLCEVENHTVLSDLINNSPLRKLDYRIIHRESPDHRGIDVALLYKADDFLPLDTNWIALKTDLGNIKSTREILYCKGVMLPEDTVHVFVNHWPSRYGGQKASELMRILAAKTLRGKIDSILIKDQNASILVMGDFNDYPNNRSIKEYLCKDDLVNLALVYEKQSVGSHKYKGKWGILDQVIVSKALFNKLPKKCFKIISNDFLLEEDERYLGLKPFRTYVGKKFNGGYSDHLPVMLKW